MSVRQRRFDSMEHRPRMLKDFLKENSNSCSSNGFKSRNPNDPPSATTAATTTMRSLIERDLNSRNTRLSESAFQTILNAVRAISFTAVKKPPSAVNEGETKTAVKIKDIVRWTSFLSVAAEEAAPPPPTATATAAESTTTCGSNGSSSSESDFTTPGYFSSWDGNFVAENAQNDVGAGEKFSLSPHVGEDSMEAAKATAAAGFKEVLTCQEEEEESPVSVLQIGEDEFSPFDQSLANIERRKQKLTMQTIQKYESLEKLDPANLEQCLSLDDNTGSDEEYDNEDNEDNEEQEWVEKRARELLHCVKVTATVQISRANLDKLLLDFFGDELNARRNKTRNEYDDEFEWEILRIAEDWMDGSFNDDIEHDNKDACIKDMDWRGSWGRLEEEQEELALEIETAILHGLVGELLDLDS